MRAAFLAPILPRVMKEGESKQAALTLMKNSHFDRTLRYHSEDFYDELQISVHRVIWHYLHAYLLMDIPGNTAEGIPALV